VARAAAAVEAPATIPPPTTAAPTTTAADAPVNNSVPPGDAPGSGTGTGDGTADGTVAATPTETTLPPGPAERPSGLVAGIFWDTLTGVGVDPGIARCAADDLIATTPEPELLTLGIASVPRPDAVNALLDTAATRCGVTRAQLDAAAAASEG